MSATILDGPLGSNPIRPPRIVNIDGIGLARERGEEIGRGMSTDKPVWPWTVYKDFPVHRTVWDKKRRRWTTENMPKDVAEKILNSALGGGEEK